MAENKNPQQEARQEALVRIMGQDIPGDKSIFVGLTRIKGISWSLANAICIKLGLDKKTKVSDLGRDKVKEIEEGIGKLEIYSFMKNRRADFDSGEDKHLIGHDLDMRKEFDIKRLKKIKSYRGNRHAFGLPTRGQRTRSHFRKGGAVGVKKPKSGKKS